MMTTRTISALALAGTLVALIAGAPEAARAWGHANASDRIVAAIAAASRPPEHRERDPRSRPEIVLSLLDVEPGDTVADIFGGGGYYAELLAELVGPDGRVILQNNSPYSKFVEKTLQARYADNQRPPIELLRSEVDDLQFGEKVLDGALMVMAFHDLYYFNPDRGWGNTDVAAFLEQLAAAMKPGARFVLVDHAAKPGSGKSAVQDLHRIDPEFVRAEVEAAGLELVASSDVLANPDDDHTRMVFDKEIRGKTDRFVLVFQKR